MSKILAVSGSPRSGGNTDTLLAEFVKGASESGSEVEAIYLRNYAINACVGCEQCRGRGFCARFDDGMSLIYPKIDASTGLILGSPVYNYNITPLMKAFIDRLFPYYIITEDKPRKFSSRLEGQARQATVFGVGEQKSERDMLLVLPAMVLPLQALGYDIIGQVLFHGLLRKTDATDNQKSLQKAREAGVHLGSNLSKVIEERDACARTLEQGVGWRFPYV